MVILGPTLAVALVLLSFSFSCCSAVADAAASPAHRWLLQVNTRCPAGCATGACVLDSTSGGYKCTKCKGQLVVQPNDGTCECPAGRYASGESCVDCDKSSYCLGGTFDGLGAPGKVGCPSDMSTIGKRSTSIKACVNMPGNFYAVSASGEPYQTSCPINTYGPGLRKQRACVPCPPGYVTAGSTGQSRVSACVVPPGYYLKGPGQVSPCPKGEWKSGFGAVASCSKCAPGVSTESEASTSRTACVVVLPTFYPAAVSPLKVVTDTQPCPQKYYCPGGKATTAFDPELPSLDGTTMVLCKFGVWTQEIGASSADQCMTPPGYKTVISGDTGATTECGPGEFRAEWAPAASASTCSVCGENIDSSATEEVTAYDVTSDATPRKVYVHAAASSCNIKPGQGMYFSAATGLFMAVNCSSNNYGVSNITYGLAAYPCRDCPAGMQTSTSLITSAAFKSDHGFTSPMACVTQKGYGYNGRVATKCPAGSYNDAGNYGTCTKCPYGLTTSNVAEGQVSIDNCTLAAGFGFHNGAIQPCPVGTYNSLRRDNTTTPCEPCPAGLTSSSTGGDAVSDCNLCAEGWGGTGSGKTCNLQCGGTNGANFGSAGREAGEKCDNCPAEAGSFNYDYLAQNQPFSPAVVARAGAASPADCLSEFAQIADTAWVMGGSAPLTTVANVSTWDACVADCKADMNCQYVYYDYDAPAGADVCFKKLAGNGSDIIGFKAVVAGEGGAYSINSTDLTKVKSLASGSYTFWKDDASAIGVRSVEVPNVNFQRCLSACDLDGGCAAVWMTGLTGPQSTPTTCRKVYGSSEIAVFKRGMTKTVVTRLRLEDVL